MKACILDVEHEEGKKLKVLLRNDKTLIAYDEFAPYFYYGGGDKDISKEDAENIEKITGIEKEGKKFLKISVKDPKYLHELEHHLPGDSYEYDIPIYFRYLIDNNLFTTKYYDFQVEKDKIKGWSEVKDSVPKFKMCAFDIEVYVSGGKMPDPEKDPVIMIGFYDGTKKKTFFWIKEKNSEKEMLQDFVETIKKEDYDIILGYNSSNFDFPYLKKRCHKFGLKLDLGRDGSEVQIRRGGVFLKADIFGRVHLDAFDSVEFLTGISALRLPSNDLDSVYKALFGKEKIKIEPENFGRYWEEGGKNFELLKEYNIEDTLAAYEIGEEVLPLFIQISKVLGLHLYEVARMSTSQMVEWLLIRESFKRKELVPLRAEEEVVRERMQHPIKGAFVKLPEPGLHERIAICDYRSLYPTLIISYNISPNTLNCKCCKDAHVAPEVGHRFCKKKKGILPQVLEELIEIRAQVKKEMKKHKEGTPEYRALHFKQWGLKILLNSAYGYQAFARGRWYCREAAESITAWARHYIHDTIARAEKAGFHVLYSDTDACFLKLGEKTKKDVEKFVEDVNKSLPEKMELEFEGYYPRCIFVTTRGGGIAAKKRYALIREDGTIEIVGFEFVRRDWSRIAKETQEKVIEAVLKEGKTQKAVEVVTKAIDDLRKKKVSTDDVKIYTKVVRALASYEQQAPHVKAAKKLIAAGYKVPAGSTIEYVVVKGKGSISDRSIPIQLLRPTHEYDAEYYINNQVLGAVMKILEMLGIKEKDLKGKGKQEGLEKWQ
jgi:DNA polymerase I